MFSLCPCAASGLSFLDFLTTLSQHTLIFVQSSIYSIHTSPVILIPLSPTVHFIYPYFSSVSLCLRTLFHPPSFMSVARVSWGLWSQDRVSQKSESIRRTWSDLDPKQACDRYTGYFQTCTLTGNTLYPGTVVSHPGQGCRSSHGGQKEKFRRKVKR